MMDIYEDDPKALETWINGLSDSERDFVDKGYLLALLSMLEQLSETQARLVNKILELEGDEDGEVDEDHKMQLYSRLHIVELYEKHYRKRADLLDQRTESFSASQTRKANF